jgi:hypothetical protein
VSAERTRLLAGVFGGLAILAAIVTAFAVGLAVLPEGEWSFVLIAGGAAVAFGFVAVRLWRRLD